MDKTQTIWQKNKRDGGKPDDMEGTDNMVKQTTSLFSIALPAFACAESRFYFEGFWFFFSFRVIL